MAQTQRLTGSTRRIIEAGGLALVLLLPVCFDPFSPASEVVWRFEPLKAAFFRACVSVMALSTAFLELREHCRKLPDQQRAFSKAGFQQWWDRNPLALPALIYAGVYILATAFSISPALSLWGTGWNPQGTATVGSAIVLFLLLSAALRTRRQVHRLMTALLLGSIPVVFYGLAQYLGRDPLPWVTDAASPVASTLGRSNYLGAYLAMLVPFTLWRLSVARTWLEKGRLALVLALQLTCLLLTWARAAWLGLLGGVLVFLGALAWRRRSRPLLAAMALTLMVGGGILAWMYRAPLPGFERQQTEAAALPESVLRLESADRRLVIWRSTLRLIPSRWLLGHGPETFALVFGSHYPQGVLYDGAESVDDPHNVLLAQLMAVGAAGTAAFLALVASFFRIAGRALLRAAGADTETIAAALLGSATAFMLQAQFNPQVTTMTMLFWLLLALGVIVYNGLEESLIKRAEYCQ